MSVLASFDAEALNGDAGLARICRFAAHLCGAPFAAVTLVHREQQKFLAKEGLAPDQTDRSTSICAHAMLQGEPLEVLDASQDSRFADFDLVRGEFHLRYYAGAPLISREGAPLGALCVFDSETHAEPLNEVQREGLIVLAEAVMRRLQAHRAAGATEKALQASADRLQSMLDSVPDIAWAADPGPTFTYFNARMLEVTGVAQCPTIDEWRKVIHEDDYEASAQKFGHAIENAIPFEDEWRLRQADGNYRWVISRAVPSSGDPKTARWFGTITDIDDSYRLLEERELLAGELAHRIKNIFSVITGLVTLHSRGDPTLKIFAETLSANIRALSRAQEFALRIDTHTGDDLKGLLEVLMAPYGVPGESAVTITGEVVETGVRAATPLALIFHELATNSAKYGALSVSEGKVAINVARDGDDVRVEWRETGGPQPDAPSTTGFGTRLVTMAVRNQLGGSIEQNWLAEGLAVAITVPASRLK